MSLKEVNTNPEFNWLDNDYSPSVTETNESDYESTPEEQQRWEEFLAEWEEIKHLSPIWRKLNGLEPLPSTVVLCDDSDEEWDGSPDLDW